MAFCSKCGSEVEPGSAFCGNCGTSAAAAAQAGYVPSATEASAGAPPPQPPPLPPQQPAFGPPQAPAAPSAPGAFGPPAGTPSAPYLAPSKGGGGGKAALFALLGLLVVGGIVVLLLGFAVGPKWFTGGGKTEQEKVVENFLQALEKKDAELLMSTIAPSGLKDFKSLVDYGYYDSIKELLEDFFFSEYESINFEGVGLKTTAKGDTANVQVTKGKVTIVDNEGGKETKDVKDADLPVEFPLLKEEGKWYIDFENM